MPESARIAEAKPDNKLEKARSKESNSAERPHPANLQAQLLYHQRTMGNQKVQRLIRSGLLPTAAKPKPAISRRELDQEEKSLQPAQNATLETAIPQGSQRSSPKLNDVSRISASANPGTRLDFPVHRVSTRSSANPPAIQRAWYNFSIPFTDYEFDPSIEGLKTAGNLAVTKAKEGASWVKDTVVAAAQWLVDKLKSVINSGIDYLTGKFNEIKEFAQSSFSDIKGAVTGALGAITNPIGLITTALGAMDAGLLSSAWRMLTSGANAAWQAVKTAVNGVLGAGGAIWDAVSGFVDSLFNTVNDLLQSEAFSLLPDVVQDPIKGLYQKVRDLWTSIRDYWTDLWKRLTSFVKGVLDSIQAFVQKVVSYAIDKVIETVTKLKEVYNFIQRFVSDPEGTLKPVINSIAAKIKAEAPGKAKDVARQKSAEAWGSRQSSQTSTTAVHRSPDSGSAATRSTTSRAEVDKNLDKQLAAQWAALDIPKMLWDTVVDTFWPPATIRAIGHEFYELWNTDWKNAASSLFTPRNIFDDFTGFWHDVWSNFLILLEFPLALWRRLTSILTLLMGYITILLVLIGIVGGAIFGGGVPGALAGAWAGVQLAGALGEALFLSFLLSESASCLRSFAALYTARQTEIEKQREYVQITASVIGMGVAFVIMLAFSLLGALAKEVVGRIKARGVEVSKELPKEEPPKQEPRREEPPKGGEKKKTVPDRAPDPGIASEDGQRKIKIDEEGKCEVCASPCDDIREKYDLVITPEDEAKIKAIEDDASLSDAEKDEKLKPIEEKLAKADKKAQALRGKKPVKPKLDGKDYKRILAGELLDLSDFMNESGQQLRIDPDYKPPQDSLGRTNAQRAKGGLAPILPNGDGVELHHTGQDFFSPLDEHSRSFHQSVLNDPDFHPSTGDPGYLSWRGEVAWYSGKMRLLGDIYDLIRAKYWRRRFK
jgi:A nuclease of the HNH/ENDO VII superfamily with conserved LHH